MTTAYEIEIAPIDALNPGFGYSLRIKANGNTIATHETSNLETALALVGAYIPKEHQS